MLDHDVDIFICVLYLDHSNFMQNIQCKFHWPWRTKPMCISHTCSTFRKNLNSFFIVGTYIHIKRDPYRCCSHNHNIQSLQPSNLAHCIIQKIEHQIYPSRLWGLQIRLVELFWMKETIFYLFWCCYMHVW